MSTDGGVPDGVDPSDPQDIVRFYHQRPVRFFEDIGFDLADVQRKILRAYNDDDVDRVLAMSGNSAGKSAGVTMAAYHFFVTNYNALVLFTSGNYQILRDTSWPFMQTIHRKAQDALPIPGTAKQSPPRIEIGGHPEWFLKYASPRRPENLQGRHARRAMVVIEEADKEDVQAGHFDAATSTASSKEDIVIATANPPTEKSNVVYDYLENDRWKVVQFSSFDSHNVLRETGDPLMLSADDLHGDPEQYDRIPGLVDLDVIREDWNDWHDRDFPDVDDLRRQIQYDPDGGYYKAADDLQHNFDPRWFRIRLGVMPPTGNATLRPWYERHVDQAVERFRQAHPDGVDDRWRRTKRVDQLGADIARGGGDRTITVGRYVDDTLQALVNQRTGDHTRNRDLLEDAVDSVQTTATFRFLVDAVGEGSGVADELRRRVQGVKRFEAGSNAAEDGEYYDARTEALVELGDRLKTDLKIPPNSVIETELRAAARTLYLEERTLRDNTVLRAKGKDALKDNSRLGRSPDAMDACAMACYTKKYSGNAEVLDIGGVVG